MRFGFSEDQRLLQRTVRDLLEKECTPQHVRAAAATESGRVPGLWRKLAETGVTGLTIPEINGGLGLGATDEVLILEEAGRACLPEPLIAAYAGAPVLAASGDDRLPHLASGDASLAIADGASTAYADDATALLLPEGPDVFVVPRGSVEIARLPTLDPTHPAFSVRWSVDAATAVATGAATEAFDHGAFAAAATLIGIGARVVEMAASYAREREQFGRQIGEFQAVKHLLANAFVGLEFARPVVYRAALSVDTVSPDRSRDVSHAKAAASEAASRACRAALQVHGAIGYTEEHDLHLWLRRGWTLARAWGDAAAHRERLAQALLP